MFSETSRFYPTPGSTFSLRAVPLHELKSVVRVRRLTRRDMRFLEHHDGRREIEHTLRDHLTTRYTGAWERQRVYFEICPDADISSLIRD